MSNKHISNGGPVYPLPVDNEQCRARFESGYGGMTLRDYFAAKAMHGFITNIDTQRSNRIDVPQLAKSSYIIADAMLRAREGHND